MWFPKIRHILTLPEGYKVTSTTTLLVKAQLSYHHQLGEYYNNIITLTSKHNMCTRTSIFVYVHVYTRLLLILIIVFSHRYNVLVQM